MTSGTELKYLHCDVQPRCHSNVPINVNTKREWNKTTCRYCRNEQLNISTFVAFCVPLCCNQARQCVMCKLSLFIDWILLVTARTMHYFYRCRYRWASNSPSNAFFHISQLRCWFISASNFSCATFT